jgi:hypothetical protein
VSEVLNPVAIEQAIRSAADLVAEAVPIVSARLGAYRDAERAFDLAWARVYMSSTGPVEERKQQCVLATAEEKQALDIAEVAYKYAERKARAAESTLSAYQTLSKSVMAMYQAAGRGEY